MSFVVSARKYRPQNFSELIGQEHISGTLINAIKNDKLAHAFLFSGPRGVGKTTAARILAKVLNCQNRTDDIQACDECSSCRSFADNASFNIFELDAASNNSVEHIRSLNDQVRFQPQQGEYKIYIIDEVHMLSQAAFNAFLKTLEEPPSYAKFILATTEKHKIIPTILSRCQTFDFKRISVLDIVKQLKFIADQENRKIDEESYHIIAQKADGAMRDALSIYDKVSSSLQGDISYPKVAEILNVLDHENYFKIVDAAIKEDLPSMMVLIDEIIKRGFEVEQLSIGLMGHLRQILFVKDVQTAEILELSDGLKKRYTDQSQLVTSSFLLNALNILDQLDMNLARSQNKRLSIEIALSKIVYLNRQIQKKKTESRTDDDITTADNSKAAVPPSTKSQQTAQSQPTSIPPLAKPIKEIPKTQVKTPTPAEPSAVAPVPLNSAPKATSSSVTSPPPSTSVVIEPKKKKQVARSILMPKVSVNLDDLVASIAEEESEKKKVNNPLTSDHIIKTMNSYRDNDDSRSLQNAFNNVKVEVEGATVAFKTPLEIYLAKIRQESELLDKIRSQYPLHDLIFRFEVDLAIFPDHKGPQPIKILSSIEKIDRMTSKNPALTVLIDQLKLKPKM